ncbi:hypothetical protein TTHERM_01332080 (macronuclear) [Tetrahymena thermophila SB210]|uniref:Uncharacterized protein n=1 Tax=Tetrahymena thermophila (strain SB210) TaxID=312017 RepID=Q22WV5_TETTS|nr:hypothetical protein TTHERM_01332080 [Tetrahymena thermophila SB210]EAR89758.2 hypothetical protein TTHERM_01332080 [Tetrahymena thermophila SB210]|eukprot:XP_001010003.2 hypothetical protein TTHERM_01332080 [Tetrahymena thermophila SB210]
MIATAGQTQVTMLSYNNPFNKPIFKKENVKQSQISPRPLTNVRSHSTIIRQSEKEQSFAFPQAAPLFQNQKLNQSPPNLALMLSDQPSQIATMFNENNSQVFDKKVEKKRSLTPKLSLMKLSQENVEKSINYSKLHLKASNNSISNYIPRDKPVLFNVRKSIEEKKRAMREEGSQIVLSYICYLDKLIQQGQKVFDLKQRKQMIQEDNLSRQMRADQILNEIQLLENKVETLKNQEKWDSFEYDVKKYMEVIQKDIKIIRMNSEIDIKKRQLGNINKLLAHLQVQYDSQKERFLDLIEQINQIGSGQEVQVMEEFIKSQLVIGGKQVYDLMLTVFDYKLMKQKVFIKEVDEYYSLRVCKLPSLVIVQQVQNLVIQQIEAYFRTIEQQNLIVSSIQNTNKAFDPSNKTLSQAYSAMLTFETYGNQLNDAKKNFQCKIEQAKQEIQNLINQVDPFQNKDLIIFLKTFTNLNHILNMFFTSFKKFHNDEEQEKIQSLVLTHLKLKQLQFCKIVETVNLNQPKIQQMESLIYQIRTTILKIQCFGTETQQLADTLKKTIEEKLELDQIINNIKKQDIFPKRDIVDFIATNRQQFLKRTRSDFYGILSRSNANFMNQFDSTINSQQKKDLIIKKAEKVKEEISRLEKIRRDNQQMLDEEMKADTISIDIQVRSETLEMFRMVDEIFKDNRQESVLIQNLLENDFPYILQITNNDQEIQFVLSPKNFPLQNIKNIRKHEQLSQNQISYSNMNHHNSTFSTTISSNTQDILQINSPNTFRFPLNDTSLNLNNNQLISIVDNKELNNQNNSNNEQLSSPLYFTQHFQNLNAQNKSQQNQISSLSLLTSNNIDISNNNIDTTNNNINISSNKIDISNNNLDIGSNNNIEVSINNNISGNNIDITSNSNIDKSNYNMNQYNSNNYNNKKMVDSSNYLNDISYSDNQNSCGSQKSIDQIEQNHSNNNTNNYLNYNMPIEIDCMMPQEEQEKSKRQQKYNNLDSSLLSNNSSFTQFQKSSSHNLNEQKTLSENFYQNQNKTQTNFDNLNKVGEMKTIHSNAINQQQNQHQINTQQLNTLINGFQINKLQENPNNNQYVNGSNFISTNNPLTSQMMGLTTINQSEEQNASQVDRCNYLNDITRKNSIANSRNYYSNEAFRSNVSNYNFENKFSQNNNAQLNQRNNQFTSNNFQSQNYCLKSQQNTNQSDENVKKQYKAKLLQSNAENKENIQFSNPLNSSNEQKNLSNRSSSQYANSKNIKRPFDNQTINKKDTFLSKQISQYQSNRNSNNLINSQIDHIQVNQVQFANLQNSINIDQILKDSNNYNSKMNIQHNLSSNYQKQMNLIDNNSNKYQSIFNNQNSFKITQIPLHIQNFQNNNSNLAKNRNDEQIFNRQNDKFSNTSIPSNSLSYSNSYKNSELPSARMQESQQCSIQLNSKNNLQEQQTSRGKSEISSFISDTNSKSSQNENSNNNFSKENISREPSYQEQNYQSNLKSNFIRQCTSQFVTNQNQSENNSNEESSNQLNLINSLDVTFQQIDDDDEEEEQIEGRRGEEQVNLNKVNDLKNRETYQINNDTIKFEKMNCQNSNYPIQTKNLDQYQTHCQQQSLINEHYEQPQIMVKHVSNSESCYIKDYRILFRQETNRYKIYNVDVNYQTWFDATQIGFFEFSMQFDMINKQLLFNQQQFQIQIPIQSIEKLVIPSNVLQLLKMNQNQQKKNQIYLLQLNVAQRGLCEILLDDYEACIHLVKDFQKIFN